MISSSIFANIERDKPEIVVKCPTQYSEKFLNNHNGPRNIFVPQKITFKGTLISSELVKLNKKTYVECRYEGKASELNNNVKGQKFVRSHSFKSCQKAQNSHHYRCL